MSTGITYKLSFRSHGRLCVLLPLQRNQSLVYKRQFFCCCFFSEWETKARIYHFTATTSKLLRRGMLKKKYKLGIMLISLRQNLLGSVVITYFVLLLSLLFRSRPFAYPLRTRGQMAIDCIERANLWLKMLTAGWKNRSEYYCMIICFDWILIKL